MNPDMIPLREPNLMTGASCAGKRFIITGATSGIGFELAHLLSHCGGEVVGVGRDGGRCRSAAQRIARETGNPLVTYEEADLSSQAQIRSLAERLGAGGSPIDVLVHNAATFTMRRSLTGDGIELQFAVNYLAGFLLSALLLSRVSEGGRIILVSSGSHFGARLRLDARGARGIYNGLAAYGQSKLAEVLFVRELARRFGGSARIWVGAADPGLVDTAIGLKGSGALVRLIWRLRAKRGASPRAAAESIAYLASSPEVTRSSGEYWRDCRIVPSSRRSYDRELAARLWDASGRMCGIEFSVPSRQMEHSR